MAIDFGMLGIPGNLALPPSPLGAPAGAAPPPDPNAPPQGFAAWKAALGQGMPGPYVPPNMNFNVGGTNYGGNPDQIVSQMDPLIGGRPSSLSLAAAHEAATQAGIQPLMDFYNGNPAPQMQMPGYQAPPQMQEPNLPGVTGQDGLPVRPSPHMDPMSGIGALIGTMVAPQTGGSLMGGVYDSAVNDANTRYMDNIQKYHMAVNQLARNYENSMNSYNASQRYGLAKADTDYKNASALDARKFGIAKTLGDQKYSESLGATTGKMADQDKTATQAVLARDSAIREDANGRADRQSAFADYLHKQSVVSQAYELFRQGEADKGAKLLNDNAVQLGKQQIENAKYMRSRGTAEDTEKIREFNADLAEKKSEAGQRFAQEKANGAISESTLTANAMARGVIRGTDGKWKFDAVLAHSIAQSAETDDGSGSGGDDGTKATLSWLRTLNGAEGSLRTAITQSENRWSSNPQLQQLYPTPQAYVDADPAVKGAAAHRETVKGMMPGQGSSAPTATAAPPGSRPTVTFPRFNKGKGYTGKVGAAPVTPPPKGSVLLPGGIGFITKGQ